MIMHDYVTAKERLTGLVDSNDYYCDKCEETITHNEETIEVSYGFICKECAGH